METCIKSRNVNRTKDISVEKAITEFVDVVEKSDKLEIVGTRPISDTANAEEVFVLKNNTIEDGIEGRYVEVSIGTIVRAFGKVKQLIDVILLDRSDIVLHGITRIVGYYSRVTNWNPSKQIELKHRVNSRTVGGYILGNQKPLFTKEAIDYMENLSDAEYKLNHI